MKRCPQCLFLYPDSDERCDFDKTPLEAVSEAEIDAATSKNRKRKVLPIIAAAGLILAVLAFAIYYAASKYDNSIKTESIAPVALAQPVVTLPSSSPSPAHAPSPSPSPSVKPSPATISASHSRATTDPVSTSGPGIGQRQGGKPVILLTSGAKIEADEVWRTRDGIWYRRNGMVTLLKHRQVKAIQTR